MGILSNLVRSDPRGRTAYLIRRNRLFRWFGF